jgi:plastocyanin
MRILPMIVGFAAILAGCASPTNDDATTQTPPPPPSPVAPPPAPVGNLVHSAQKGDSYGGNLFEPATLTVNADEKVTWDVTGEGHHTVDFLTPINAAGETPKSGDLGPGQTFEVTFNEPGTYKYYCKYQSNKQTGMVGTITVE